MKISMRTREECETLQISRYKTGIFRGIKRNDCMIVNHKILSNFVVEFKKYYTGSNIRPFINI